MMAVRGTYKGSAACSAQCRDGERTKERNRAETAGTQKKEGKTRADVLRS